MFSYPSDTILLNCETVVFNSTLWNYLEVRVDAANWAINDRQVLGKERLVAFAGFTVS